MKSTRILFRLALLCLATVILLGSMLACKPATSGMTIGENGNWFLDGVDTGVPAQGQNGTQVTIGENGNWFVNGEDTGVPTLGQNGTGITIGENGNWFIDGVDSGVPATGNPPPEAPVLPPPTPDTPTEFTPVVRFLVTSDVHLRTTENDYQSYANLQKLYADAYAYSEAQAYNKLDGIFIVGDFTQSGTEEEMTKFFNYVNANTKAGTTVRAILGNHEYLDAGRKYEDEESSRFGPKALAETYAKYLSISGYETVDAHLVLNGYHLLMLNLDRYTDDYESSKYSPERLNWLQQELTKAAADDPTGKKPIFVFHHAPAAGTVNNASAAAGDDAIGTILAQYPQAVSFSGHTHFPITDPTSIWQGDYTAINTGSLAYHALYINNHPTHATETVRATDNEGGWMVSTSSTVWRNAVLYYFVEISADNEIRLVVNDITTGSTFTVIELGHVGDPEAFTFTDARRQNATKPQFADDARLTVGTLTQTAATLTIPQATCPDTVNSYRCEIYRNGTLYRTVYRLACQYLGNAAPKTLSLPLTAIVPDSTYTVKVYPVSAWGVEGEPLEGTFATPAVNEISADLLSVLFNADGSAVNAVTGETLAAIGTPTVSTDALLNRNVAILDGQSGYRFDGIKNHYATMNTGFTFETYVFVDSIPSTGYVDLVSNQQAGGFGLELKSTGDLQFIINIGGSSTVRPSVQVTTGEWMHIVVVYDSTMLHMYKDGVLVSSVTPLAGTIKLPATAAQYLCIGGDSNLENGDNFMTGKIATVNLYSFALSEQMVKDIYAKY